MANILKNLYNQVSSVLSTNSYLKNENQTLKQQNVQLMQETMSLEKQTGKTKVTTLIVADTIRADNPAVDVKELVKEAINDPDVRSAIEAKLESVFAGRLLIESLPDSGELAEAEIKEFEEFMKTAGGGLPDSETGLLTEQSNYNQVLRKIVYSLCMYDEIYIEIVENKEGKPAQLNILDPSEMTVNIDSKGRLRDLVVAPDGRIVNGAYIQTRHGQIIGIFPADKIIHANYYSMASEVYGNSLLKTIKNAMKTKDFAQKYSKAIFENQRPKGVWEIEGTEEEFEANVSQIKESKNQPEMDMFIRRMPGQAQGSQKAITYTTLSMEKDMPFPEFFRIMREEILAGIRTPAGAIGISTKETSGWDAQTQLHVWYDSIEGIQEFIEAIQNERILPRFDFKYIKISFEKKNKRDEERLFKQAQLAKGILTLNEIRNMLGFPEIDGGDVIQQQTFNPGGFGNNDPNSSMEETTVTQGFRDIHAIPKDPTYIRKILSQPGIIRQKFLPIVEDKRIKQDLNARIRLKNLYARKLKNNFEGFIDKAIEEIENSNIAKQLDKRKKMDIINELSLPYVLSSKEISRLYLTMTFDEGAKLASSDAGIAFYKTTIDQDALDFLDSMNIEIIEGAYSSASASIKTAIRLGIQNGDSTKEIARRLRGSDSSVLEVYKRRFDTIARTEVNRAMSEGRINAYERSGTVKKVQALIGLGPDNKGICESVLGGRQGGLGRIMTLEESRGLIPSHPNCSCIWLPIIE